MEFLPDGGHAVPIESGETMSRRPRRNHAPGFEAGGGGGGGRKAQLENGLRIFLARTALQRLNRRSM